MNIQLNSFRETLNQHSITEACESFLNRSSRALRHCATSEFAWNVLTGFVAGAIAGAAGRLFAKGMLRTGLSILGSSSGVAQFEKIALRQLLKTKAFNQLGLRLAAGFSSYFVNANLFNRMMGHSSNVNNLRTTADFMLMHPGSVLAQSLLSRVSPLPLRIFGDFLLGGLNFCVSSGTRVALENLVHETDDTFAAHVTLEQVIEGGAMHLGNRVAEATVGRVAELSLEHIQEKVRDMVFSVALLFPELALAEQGTSVLMMSGGREFVGKETPLEITNRKAQAIKAAQKIGGRHPDYPELLWVPAGKFRMGDPLRNERGKNWGSDIE